MVVFRCLLADAVEGLFIIAQALDRLEIGGKLDR